MQTVDDTLITAEELSSILKLSERTLWRLLSGGKLPHPVRIGGSTRWRLSEIQQWISQGCPTPNNAERR